MVSLGQIVLENFAEVDTLLAIVGCVPAFRGRGLGSTVDLTYLSTSFGRRMFCPVREHYKEKVAVVCTTKLEIPRLLAGLPDLSKRKNSWQR